MSRHPARTRVASVLGMLGAGVALAAATSACATTDATAHAGSSETLTASPAPQVRTRRPPEETGAPPAGQGAVTATNEWLEPMNAARAAVGEQPLTWDPLAARVAQAYASLCKFDHNPKAGAQYASAGGSGGLGENISAGAPTQAVSDAVASWVSEKASYDHASNSCRSGQSCGHYTQIVWATTTAVGCAHVSCTTGSPFGGGTWDFSVCDFHPPGNWNGQPPY